MEKLKIEEIEAEISRKHIRNIYISVNASTGKTEITAPVRMPVPAIEEFVKSKLKWIRKHTKTALSAPPVIKNNYVEGEKVELLGKKYDLKVFNVSSKPKVFVTFSTIDLYIKASAGISERRKAVDSFYAAKLREIVPEMAAKWAEKMKIVTEKNLISFLLKKAKSKVKSCRQNIKTESVVLQRPVKFYFRKMKSRWGSCNISDRQITLNTELAKKTPRCVEYVTAHELLHLKERKHSKDFNKYMQEAFPDWKTLESELKIIV